MKRIFTVLKLIKIMIVFLLTTTVFSFIFPFSINARMGDEENPYGFWVNRISLNIIMDRLYLRRGSDTGKSFSSKDDVDMAERKNKKKEYYGATSSRDDNEEMSSFHNESVGKINQATVADRSFSKRERLDRGQTVDKKDADEEKKHSTDVHPTGHDLMRSKTPVESLYLVLKGADKLDEAPEVYYKFTNRTLGRRGGVPIGSKFYRAKVQKDINGFWRADLIGKTFGTFEVYSRYKVKGYTFYSQFNIIHNVREDIKHGPDAEIAPGLPGDWPEYIFPVNKFNKMPFSGMETGATVDFVVLRGEKPVIAINSYLLDAKDGPYMPVSITLKDSFLGKYSFSPPHDPYLFVSPTSPKPKPGDRAGVKDMVSLLELPNKEFMTFTLTVNRSRWIYKKLGLGLVFVCTVVTVVGLMTAHRRRKFKYNEFD